MKRREFIGTCVENPFDRIEILAGIVNQAEEISRQTFLEHCVVHEDILRDMRRFPNDYSYYKYKTIYFYDWSAIEHFYN